MGVIVVILFHTMPASMYQKMVVKKTQLKNKACDVTFCCCGFVPMCQALKDKRACLFLVVVVVVDISSFFNLTSWQKWHEEEDQKVNKPTPFPLFNANNTTASIFVHLPYFLWLTHSLPLLYLFPLYLFQTTLPWGQLFKTSTVGLCNRTWHTK